MIYTLDEARDILHLDGEDNDEQILALLDAIPPYSEKRKPPLFVITLFSSNLSCTNCQDKHAKGNIDYWKQTIKNHVIIDNIHIAIITITQSAHNSRKNI